MSDKKSKNKKTQGLGTVFNFVGNTFCHQPENYIIGAVEKGIANSNVTLAEPNSNGNPFYSEMLGATQIEPYGYLESSTKDTMISWYKFVANGCKAHIDGAKGVYNINLLPINQAFMADINLYTVSGTLIPSNQIGTNRVSAELDFGQTYFVKVTTLISATYMVNLTYENVGGETGAVSTEIMDNSLYIFSQSVSGLPINYKLKKAEMTFYQKSAVGENILNCRLGIYKLNESFNPGVALEKTSHLFDYAKIRINEDEVVSYTFDITDWIEATLKEPQEFCNLVLSLCEENLGKDNFVELYGNEHSEYAPKMTVTYEKNFGVNTSYRAYNHDLGFFGQGSVDLQYGNLMLESTDFSWAGERLPVTIKHLYNSSLYNEQYTQKSSIGLNTADFSAMKLGYGFKLNVMQSIVKDSDGDYIYINENGEEIYLLATDNEDIFKSCEEDGELEFCESKRILKNGDEYLFDEAGRLICITDQSGNTNKITYEEDKLTMVCDAVGRKFIFSYNTNNFLTSITAPDSTQVAFAYTGNCLSTVTYPDGKKAEITYTNNKLKEIVLYENDIAVYKTEYTHSNCGTVAKMIEYGVDNGKFIKGNTTKFEYSIAAHKTTVSINSNYKTVYVFDEEGNVISEYFDDYMEKIGIQGGDGSENFNFQTLVSNQLINHNFTSLNNWQMEKNNLSSTEISIFEDESKAKFGKHLLLIKTNEDNAISNGVYQECRPSGFSNCTFSAYVKIVSGFEGENDGVYLQICDEYLEVIAQSEKIKAKDNEFIRISVTESLMQSFVNNFKILADGKGEIYIDSVQLEKNPSANSYNILSNGSFSGNHSWKVSNEENCYYYNEYITDHFDCISSLEIRGVLFDKCNANQTVEVKSAQSTRETFKLSGWANGYGLPVGDNKGENPPTFRLRAVINYTDGTFCENTADFCTCAEEWQYTSVEFSKDAFKEVDNLQVFCDYDYNSGTVYFDNIELIRTSIETGLSEDDFITVEETEGSVEGEASEITETTEETNEFKELLDAFGNTLTETTFTDGEFGTIYRSFGYDADGNNLVKETDARGNVTEYTVDGVTSRNEEITDRMGNKTAYTYDDSGRTSSVSSKNAEGDELANVSYKYDSFDNLTEIVRGDGLKYVLKYNAFRDLESIGIDGKTGGDLITYGYNTGSGRLKEMTYANGDKMTATYNSYGQMIAEKWYDKDGNQTAYYTYAYDGQGNIVRSIDILAKKMYNYMYDDGKLSYACESKIAIDEYNYITSKTPLYTVYYFYDNEHNLTRKRTIFADGKEQIVSYTTTENESQLVKTEVGGHSFVSTSKTDSFGRKEFDELQLGSGFVSRQFDYLNGEVTEEHKQNKMLKSTPTTQLVSEITFSDGRTIDYEYDKEERITKVIDSVEGVTEYTYDALGQLLTEVKNGEVINEMLYDNYGNIVQKNGIDYAYNGVWKDRLSHFGGKQITYDAQGNPLDYLGHILFWEKGRQLRSFDNTTYTYNANGIRTSKTVDGIRHDFHLDGGKILREVWIDNVLETVFDNEESVCGIVYNQEPFYFVKNLQGDIIAITDKDGEVVARYTYDAWGKCTIDSSSKNPIIAKVNPFRYRSYYYDIETGLYYLQSRYYDAEVGRFLNGDMVEFAVMQQGAVEHNLFAYCGNEPVDNVDTYGNWYQEIGSTTSQKILDAIARSLDSYIKSNSKWWIRFLTGVGDALIGSIKKYNIGNAKTLIDIVISSIPKINDEIGAIRYILDEIRWKYYSTKNRIFKLFILFGSHRLQFKIEVMVNNKLKKKVIFRFYHNSIVTLLHNHFVKNGIKLKQTVVAVKFKYS